jgi:Flp pilus assembly protein TadD
VTATALKALQTGDVKTALRRLQQHLVVDPADADATNLLGMAQLDLIDLRAFTTAPAAVYRSLALVPNDPAFLHNLGLSLLRAGQLSLSRRALRRSLALVPDFVSCHLDFGNIAARHGDYREARRSYDRALALVPDHVSARQNRGWARLALGDFENGFRDYSWRWQLPPFAALTAGLPGRRWNGEPFTGTLLLIAEQGFGDTLQFCRLAREASQRVTRVVLEVQPQLAKLISRSLPAVEVIGRHPEFPRPDRRPPHDRYTALLDLPALLGMSVRDIPGKTPYLFAEAEKTAAWAARLDAISKGRSRIGLAWSGNPRADDRAAAEVDRRRSVPFSAFRTLLEVPDLSFISLQTGTAAADASHDRSLLDLSAELHDFDDTAAVVANLDLVVTVDTAVAHLAGAIGKPVWVLSRLDNCWRWLTERSDSPWYPTMRLFRQSVPNDWSSVLSLVRESLSTCWRERLP